MTVLHRFLKMLFIMKSTKTIFAISSIGCIRKTLNSSSSCSHEQVYFSKRKVFINCYDAKKKPSNFWVCTDDHEDLFTCMTEFVFWFIFILFVSFIFFFFFLYEMDFLKFKIVKHLRRCSVLAVCECCFSAVLQL